MNNHHAYIAIEGVIGVGKTTLTRLLAPLFRAQTLLEVFEENPFLARFYEDRDRYAFQTQTFFLLSRFQQQHDAIPAALETGSLLSDYAFDKNKIFARLTLSGDELEMYERVQDILGGRIPTPNLMVYLRASVDQLMERIALRDRSYERTMDPEYIAALAHSYDTYFAAFTAAPVLTLETDALDYIHNPQDLATVAERIQARLRESAFQGKLFSIMQSYIVVAGNIGVGKSTLVNIMHERLGWEPFYEAVVENPYLADFYADMPRWAFQSQLFFLTRRLQAHHALLSRPGIVVQDRSVYEDAEIFARNLFRQGRMSDRDYATYSDLYDVLKLFLPPPQLVVYLQASVGVLLKRIASRGREYEQNIEPAYLEQLNELYDEWAQRFTQAPVLTVPADRLDFVHYDHDLQLVLAKIQDKLRGDQYVLFE